MNRSLIRPLLPPILAAFLALLLPANETIEAAERTAPPSIKFPKLGADDVILRIHYVTHRPVREAWLTLQRLGNVSTAYYQVVAPTRDISNPPLPAPQVPWTAIWQEMTDTGFYGLPDENATEACETEPIPVDAPQIAVEVRQGAHLHHFVYGAPLTRQCPAAERAATTLRFLQEAFGHALPLP